MKKKIGLILALAAVALVGKANATITVSTMSASGVAAVAAPSTGKTVIKGCTLSNDSAVASCAQLYDGATLKLQLCAGAQATTNWPSGVPSATGNSGTSGAGPQFFGEDLSLSGAFNIKSSSPSASVILTCASTNR